MQDSPEFNAFLLASYMLNTISALLYMIQEVYLHVNKGVLVDYRKQKNHKNSVLKEKQLQLSLPGSIL